MHKYRVLGKKGEGTFSEVLRAQCIKNGKYCAIKRMKARFESISQVNSLREIQALRRLSPHPNIVKLLEVLFDKPTGRVALVFELMEQNVYEMIRGRKHYVPQARVKNYLYQLMKSLDHMHRSGIFHRDIKPENILLLDSRLKLCDFGSCRGIYSKPPYTEYISTRWYRAPECLLTDGGYNYKMDMWGAGCVAFEVMSLFPLFPGTNELEQIQKIHAVTGTPSPELLAKIRKGCSSHLNYNFPKVKGTGIAKLLPHVPRDGIDLISRLVAYDPDDRLSARAALRHPYFKECREKDKAQGVDPVELGEEQPERSLRDPPRENRQPPRRHRHHRHHHKGGNPKHAEKDVPVEKKKPSMEVESKPVAKELPQLPAVVKSTSMEAVPLRKEKKSARSTPVAAESPRMVERRRKEENRELERAERERRLRQLEEVEQRRRERQERKLAMERERERQRQLDWEAELERERARVLAEKARKEQEEQEEQERREREEQQRKEKEERQRRKRRELERKQAEMERERKQKELERHQRRRREFEKLERERELRRQQHEMEKMQQMMKESVQTPEQELVRPPVRTADSNDSGQGEREQPNHRRHRRKHRRHRTREKAHSSGSISGGLSGGGWEKGGALPQIQPVTRRISPEVGGVPPHRSRKSAGGGGPTSGSSGEIYSPRVGRVALPERRSRSDANSALPPLASRIPHAHGPAPKVQHKKEDRTRPGAGVWQLDTGNSGGSGGAMKGAGGLGGGLGVVRLGGMSGAASSVPRRPGQQVPMGGARFVAQIQVKESRYKGPRRLPPNLRQQYGGGLARAHLDPMPVHGGGVKSKNLNPQYVSPYSQKYHREQQGRGY